MILKFFAYHNQCYNSIFQNYSKNFRFIIINVIIQYFKIILKIFAHHNFEILNYNIDYDKRKFLESLHINNTKNSINDKNWNIFKKYIW